MVTSYGTHEMIRRADLPGVAEFLDFLSIDIPVQEITSEIGELVEITVVFAQKIDFDEIQASFTHVLAVVVDVARNYLGGCEDIVILEKRGGSRSQPARTTIPSQPSLSVSLHPYGKNSTLSFINLTTFVVG